MRNSLDRRIEDKRDDLVALTQALVRIPTVNPPGEAYRPCAELLGARLAARGFQIAYIRGEGAVGDSEAFPRTNVVARFEGAAPGPTVHFNGHIDVVGAGAGWTRDPFGAVVEDGKIYGRGTCDMKGGLAAAVIAVEALIEEPEDFPGAIEISGTVDEESGGDAGVAYLARQGRFSKPNVDHVIIPEPLNVDRVCLGHRGVWWAEIETEGKMAHGSMPFLGDCAVRHMGAVLARLEQELYPSLAARRTNMPVVPEGARQSTLNINSLHGGLAEGFDGLPSPLVPDRCRMVIDRRFLIEENLEEVKAEVRGLLETLALERPNFRYSLRDVMEVLPTMTDARAPVVRAVSAQIERVLGRPAQHVISPGSYDQKHVARIGHLDDCIAYGPGILDLAHQPDEYVVIDDMVNSAKVMAGAARQLLTGAAP
jgi:succinyl-diaminopimelate desuccinylase